MTVDEVRALVSGGESETLEFKKSTSQLRSAVRSVCAMLNNRGGHVLFGISPEGEVTGQQIGKRTLEDISRELQRIDPIVYPSIDVVQIQDGLGVIVIRVGQGLQRPYAHNGTACQRVGDTIVELKGEQRDRLVVDRLGATYSWERQPAPGWAIDDLDLDLLDEIIEKPILQGRAPKSRGKRAPEESLRGLDLLEGKALRRAAVVLFGKNDRLGGDFPQCHIRLARFLGVDRREFSDNRQFHGNAFTLFSQAERFLFESIPVASRIESDRFVRVDTPLYPRPATREAVANALCHRDYSIEGGSVGVAIYDDRLEVTSPGRLPPGITREDLFVPHESVRRNPLVANAFYRCGITEQWGRGTLDMMEQSAEAGLPELEISEGRQWVTVRFRNGKSGDIERRGIRLSDTQKAILGLFPGAEDALPFREIFAKLGGQSNGRRLRDELSHLRTLGILDTTGRGRGALWRRRKGS